MPATDPSMRTPTSGLAAVFAAADAAGGSGADLEAAWTAGGEPTTLKNATRTRSRAFSFVCMLSEGRGQGRGRGRG